MQIIFLSGVKSADFYQCNKALFKSFQYLPLTLAISGGPLSTIIGIPKSINKQHIRVSTRAASCSAPFKGLPVGTEIKLQKPGDLLQKRSHSLKAMLRLRLPRRGR